MKWETVLTEEGCYWQRAKVGPGLTVVVEYPDPMKVSDWNATLMADDDVDNDTFLCSSPTREQCKAQAEVAIRALAKRQVKFWQRVAK